MGPMPYPIPGGQYPIPHAGGAHEGMHDGGGHMAMGGHAGLGGQQVGVAHGPCSRQPTNLKGSATAPATNLKVPLTIMHRGLSSH